VLVETVCALAKDYPEILNSLTIVAIGDQYIADCLRDCSIRLYSPGYIDSDEELARLYAVADVFLNTSLADGGPVMLAQALMSGTPVITTDVGLARDLVSPPLNGQILTRPSAADLVTAVAEFCGKSEIELQEMRKQARRLALEHLGKENYMNEVGKLVEELIGGH
jgi:glycosyltransferase involved in cell wall biosynthesis